MSLAVPVYSRLLSWLNQTKLQQTNNAEYQFLKGLLDAVKQFSDDVAGEINNSPLPDIINKPFLTAGDPLPELPFGRDLLAGTGIAFDDSVDNERTVSATVTSKGLMPYFIPIAETYTVSENEQGLFNLLIDIEGYLDVEGYLVYVDGNGSDDSCCTVPVFFPESQDSELSFPIPGPAGIQGLQGPPGIPGFDGDSYEIPYPCGTLNPVAGVFTLTATGNIDDLDFGNASLIRCTGTGAIPNIRGLKAGSAGQRVTILRIAAGGSEYMTITHASTGSIAANRIGCIVTSAPTTCNIAGGSASLVYDNTSERWRMYAHNGGSPITPTFAAGDYTAGGAMTWTLAAGDVGIQTYCLNGNLLTIAWVLITTTTAGVAANTLIMGSNLWGGFTIPNQVAPIAYLNDSVAIVPGYANPNGTTMTLTKLDGTNFALAANLVYTYGTITVTVT